MPGYEYKVIPAPKKPGKVKGVRGTDLKFAAALAEIMNTLGRDGWEYQRTDTLPCEVRQGLTGRTTTFQNMLVFRRAIDEPVEMSVRTPTRPDAAIAEPAAPAEVRATEVPALRPGAGKSPALAPATHDAPQGAAPRIGAARGSDTAEKSPGRPDLAAQ